MNTPKKQKVLQWQHTTEAWWNIVVVAYETRRKITSQIEDMLGGRIISGELPDNSKAEIYPTDEGFGVRILAANRR